MIDYGNPADVLSAWIKIETEAKPKTHIACKESGWYDRYTMILDALVALGYGHFTL